MALVPVAHISDWHTTARGAERDLRDHLHSTRLGPLPEVELLFVTGDMLVNTRAWNLRDLKGEGEFQRKEWEGMVEALEEFWPGADIFAVPGNHDYCGYGIAGHVKSIDAPGVHTIKSGSLTVTGFRGVPVFHGSWNDEYNDRALEVLVSKLPKKADVLLTHCPPYGLFDDVHDGGDWNGIVIPPRRIGIHGLRGKAKDIKGLKAHCFGHVHERSGATITDSGVRFSNAACTINYFNIEV